MRTPPRLVRLFSFAVIDQALLSGANFLLAFLLIRNTSGADYGLFVLAQATILALIVAQGSWISGPLYVLVPKKTPEARRDMVGAIERSQRRLLRALAVAALFVPPLGGLLGFWSGNTALIAFIAVFAAWFALLREYNRVVLLAYSRTRMLLNIDIIYVAVLIGGAFAAIHAPLHGSIGGHALPLSVVAWAVLALALASWIAWYFAHRRLARDPGWAPVADSRPYWRELQPLAVWSTVGSGIYWLFSQSYNYVIAAQIGLDAVADVNATRILLMPAILITVGVRGLLIPSAAGWLVEHGIAKLLRRLALFVVGIGMLDLVYFAFVWIFRDWLTADLMKRRIGDLDELLLLWLGVALLGLARDMLQSALQALERFKIVAALTGVGAVLSLTIMWFGLPHWGAPATLVGQIVGETVILIGTVLLAWQSQRRAAAAAAAAAVVVPPA